MRLGNNNHAKELQTALQSNNDAEIQQAWNNFSDAIVAEIRNDYMESVNDKNVLAQRGYRTLTNAEEKFYDIFVKSAQSRNPQQMFIELTNNEDALMPETIIEDVFKGLVEEHPLLSKVNFVSASYLTTWVLNDANKQTAVWGQVTSQIAEEVMGAFKVIDMKQNKLSAYAQIPMGILQLGKSFIDAYIRRVLAESIAVALEKAIIDGTGKNMPIGLMRNCGEDASVVSGEYPAKEAQEITALDPATYGQILGKMAVTENGYNRKINNVALIVNNVDYFQKVMPAITKVNANGQYVEALPFPTDIIVSNEVPAGKAIVALLDEYFMGVTGSKEGTIEFSDEYKFLEDLRTFKVKMFATGKPNDNTCAMVLDITNLK